MGFRLDITGKRFGKLNVLGFFGNGEHGESLWECVCDCGGSINACLSHLQSGNTRSCGCLRGQNNLRHGMNGTPEYIAWQEMKKRCSNPNTKNYFRYGGRGIKVCERWLECFENFFTDMGLKPSRQHSLDRFPDNNGNYEPGNCRWATLREQSLNRRTNVRLTYAGKTLTIQEWSEETGMNRKVIESRIKGGKMSASEILTIPVGAVPGKPGRHTS